MGRFAPACLGGGPRPPDAAGVAPRGLAGEAWRRRMGGGGGRSCRVWLPFPRRLGNRGSRWFWFPFQSCECPSAFSFLSTVSPGWVSPCL